MSISYAQKDELPVWEAVVTLNRLEQDFSDPGWTYEVKVYEDATTPLLEKTEGIVGYSDSSIQVNWDTDELDLPPGTYKAQLTASKDGREATVIDDLIIRERA